MKHPTGRMVYDAGRGRVILVGHGESGRKADTWEYDGTTWIRRSTSATEKG